MNTEFQQEQNLPDMLVAARVLLDQALVAMDLEALSSTDGRRAVLDLSALISALDKSLQNADQELDFVMSAIWLGREQELSDVRRRVDGLIARGVRVRKLYTSEMLTGSKSGLRLRRDLNRGLGVRITDRDLAFMTTIDLTVAFIAIGRSPRSAEFSRVTDALGVGVLHSLFNALWDISVDARLVLQMGDDGWVGRVPAILKMLCAGHTDDCAAGKLGMSVRTYRRHVADIMHKLNASSRFEAGYRAAQLGIIRREAAAHMLIPKD